MYCDNGIRVEFVPPRGGRSIIIEAMWVARERDDFPFDVSAFIKHLSSGPGVYRMIDANDAVLYVGKAKNLKRRVGSYFNKNNQAIKTLRMLTKLDHIEITRTLTEGEALILENTLIKQHKPPFNILLRDDKSFPYLKVTTKDDFPRISFYRGSKKAPGEYFGPFPSSGAVRESLTYLQRLFQLRPCEDSVFKNRTRACLQYQIKRCSGPCVGHISTEDYGEDVEHALMFLRGKNDQIVTDLVAKMEAASEALNFEAAARYRDQVHSLQQMQQKQAVESGNSNADVLGVSAASGQACVAVTFIRNGRNLGHRSFFPKVPADSAEDEVLEAFIMQYYPARQVPDEILISRELESITAMSEVLSEHAGRKVYVRSNVRANRKQWLRMAQLTAEQALTSRLAADANQRNRLESLQRLLDLEELPERLECFDISHSFGEATVASCVVFDQNGPAKQFYRRFNIEGITGGDDYAAMEQALTRRYKRVRDEDGIMPDIVFIDGGKGQLNMAIDVFAELGITDVLLVGVAKGVERKAGFEQLFVGDSDSLVRPPADAPALHLIQQIRDEAHRFAITGHRGRRDKARKKSTLEAIPGLGPKRRQALLKHFGGLPGVTSAGVEDLTRVTGISQALAEKIYEHFHDNN